jgi:hypothetical protein
MAMRWHVGCLVALLLFAVAGTADAEGRVLFAEDFEDAAVGSLPEGWGTRGNAASVQKAFRVVEDPKISTGKVLMQAAGAGAEGYLLTPAISSETSRVIISFRLRWQPSETKPLNAGFYLFSEGAPWPPYASMFWGDSQGTVSVFGEFDGKQQSRSTIALETGVFHQFELDVDLDASVFYLTIDGRRWEEPLYFRSPGTSFLPFHLGLYWKDDKPDIYWDDFVVSEAE